MCKHVSLPFIVSFRPVFAIVRERMMLKRMLILGDNIVNYEGFGGCMIVFPRLGGTIYPSQIKELVLCPYIPNVFNRPGP